MREEENILTKRRLAKETPRRVGRIDSNENGHLRLINNSFSSPFLSPSFFSSLSVISQSTLRIELSFKSSHLDQKSNVIETSVPESSLTLSSQTSGTFNLLKLKEQLTWTQMMSSDWSLHYFLRANFHLKPNRINFFDCRKSPSLKLPAS